MKARFNEKEYYKAAKGYKAYNVSVPGIEILVNEEQLTACFFSGKRTKADWKYRFGDKFKMIKKIDESVKAHYDFIKAKEARKIQAKVDREQHAKIVKVGDIFATSWGYDQTNVDFFQVIDRPSKAYATVRKIAKNVKDTGYMCGEATPCPGEFIDDPKKCQISQYGSLRKADRYGNSAYPTTPDASHFCSWYA